MSEIFKICERFQGDPVRFANIVLGVTLSLDQKNILRSLTVPPYKTLVRSCNNAGKSYVAAVAALYMYYCFNPSITLITAPVFQQIQKTVVKECRTLGERLPGKWSPKAPELFDTFNHMILGVTATSADAFRGIHDAAVTVIVDEMTGVEGEFIDAIHTMLGGTGYFFLGLFNPTDQTSKAFTSEMDAQRSGAYHVFELNALKHPNIEAELKGLEPPFPNAIRLERLRENIKLWCDETIEPLDTDFQFEGKWWHPGPVAEASVLGRWPSQAADNIWTLALFEKCCQTEPIYGHPSDMQFGVDIAAFGDDDSVISIRKGNALVYMESHNGWSITQIATRVKELADQYKEKYNLHPPEKIAIALDDTGVGAGMRDMGEGYAFHPINFSGRSWKPSLYRNRRDEIHFTIADAARLGNVSFKMIPKWQQDDLRSQLLAPKYKLDYSGRRIVEHKSKTKELLGKSPDMGDSVMLSFMRVNADVIEYKPLVLPKRERKF